MTSDCWLRLLEHWGLKRRRFVCCPAQWCSTWALPSACHPFEHECAYSRFYKALQDLCGVNGITLLLQIAVCRLWVAYLPQVQRILPSASSTSIYSTPP
jgi:hypothetical protein